MDMAFANCLPMIFHTDGRFGGLSLFGPYVSIRFAASESLRPFSASDERASRTLLEAAVWGAKGKACETAVLRVSVF
jgi:hypothetical protein